MILRKVLTALLLGGILMTATRTSAAPAVTFSIASGDVTQDSVVLWAHGEPGEVTFSIFEEGQTKPEQTAKATITDAMIPVKVDLGDLDAGSRYTYMVETGALKQTGTFKTPAAPGKKVGLRFGVSGDWRQELAPYPSIANIPDRKLDFFIEEGDSIYADFASPDVPVKQATTLAEYRAKHNENFNPRGGLNTWPLVRQSTALFATIDDHEVTNDFAGGAPVGSDGRFDKTGTYLNDTQRFKNGLQAFMEYYPIRSTSYPPEGDALYKGKPDLYRFRQFGDDAAIFLLDSRTFRSQGIPTIPFDKVTDETQRKNFLKVSFNPSRTLLGKSQLSQLKANLLAAQKEGVTWKFILNPEPIQNLGLLNAQDRWEGYMAERTELLKFITDNKLLNVVFVTADFHGTLINNLFYQEVPDGKNIPVPAWEIITGPVAFDAPFGPTVIELATAAKLLKPEQAALYLLAGPDQKESAIRALTDAQIKYFGYDPLGIEPSSGIEATLLKGGWTATHSYGWTEFEIDAATQNLLVTTYGIPWYTVKQAASEPEKIAARTPIVISQFAVKAK